MGGRETRQKVRTSGAGIPASGLHLLLRAGGSNPEQAAGGGVGVRAVPPNSGEESAGESEPSKTQAGFGRNDAGWRLRAGGWSLTAQWLLCSGRKFLRWPGQWPH